MQEEDRGKMRKVKEKVERIQKDDEGGKYGKIEEKERNEGMQKKIRYCNDILYETTRWRKMKET